MPTERRLGRMREVLARRQLDLHVVVENVHDPHNASALLRTADGLGFHHVHLLYHVEEAPRLAPGVTRRIERWLDVRRFEAFATWREAVRALGVRVYATSLQPDARSYLDVDWTEPCAVVFGNEHRGVSAEVLGMADEAVVVPMRGFAQSFNVSVSAAIVLAEAHRQRLGRGRYEPEWDEEREAIWRAWLAREA